MWANGVFGVDVENGVYDSTQGHTVKGFTISDNVLSASGAISERVTLVTKNNINFSAYSSIKAITSLGELECNVSGYSGMGYLYVVFAPTGSVHIGVSTQKANFENNRVPNVDFAYKETTSNTMTISEIEIE